MPQIKAKIVTAEYQEKKDLLIFTIKDTETDRDQTYCWPPCDYFAAIGISPKAEYTAAQLSKHCSDMIGKSLSFVIEGEMPEVEPVTNAEVVEAVYKECADLAAQAGERLGEELKIAKEIALPHNLPPLI